MKKLIFSIALLGLTTMSCVNDDSNPSTPIALCNDVNYYGLRTNNMSNTSGLIEVVTNSSSDFNTTTFNSVYSANANGTIGNNSSAYDPVTETMVYIDQFNNDNDLVIYNIATNTTSSAALNIPNTNWATAPVFINGDLYIIEVNLTLNEMYLKKVTNIAAGITSTPLLTVSTSTFGMANDTMGNKVFATSNGVDKLYFLGDKLMEIDLGSAVSFTVKPLPANAGDRYIDIVHTQTGELMSVLHKISSTGNTVDLVKLDVSQAAISQTTYASGLAVNPESISLVYKECGDVLHILTHLTFSGSNPDSTILEISMQNGTLVSRNFAGFMFGIIHKSI